MDEGFDAYVDAAVVLGQWVDRTLVRRDPGIFTIDFVRHVPAPAERFLVARVLLTPPAALDLRDPLDDACRGYSEWSTPKENG